MPLEPMPSRRNGHIGNNFAQDISFEEAKPSGALGDNVDSIDLDFEDDDDVISKAENNIESFSLDLGEDLEETSSSSSFLGSYDDDVLDNRTAKDILVEALEDPDVSEISINGPREFFIRKKGTNIRLREFDAGTTEEYHTMLNQTLVSRANGSVKPISDDYIIEMKIPIHYKNGIESYARCHILTPPIVYNSVVTIAKRPPKLISLYDMIEGKTLSEQMAQFLLDATKLNKNIVVSGASGAGKTTLLSAIGDAAYRDDEKLIVIEDLPELDFEKEFSTYLVTTPEKPGIDPNRVTMDYLVRQTKRMRGARIVVGEVRGPEILSFLDVATSIDGGAMNTLHSESAKGALDTIRDLASGTGSGASESAIEGLKSKIAKAVDIIVQVRREEGVANGRHIVTEIIEVGKTLQNKNIPSTTLFEYNVAADRFIVKNPPSDKLKEEIISHDLKSRITFRL